MPHSSELPKESDLGSDHLEDKFRSELKRGLYGDPKSRTLEEAMQEALDDTTPSEPGVPGRNDDDPAPPEDEWI